MSPLALCEGCPTEFSCVDEGCQRLKNHTGQPPTILPQQPRNDPCEVLCRECKADGICIKKNPYHALSPMNSVLPK